MLIKRSDLPELIEWVDEKKILVLKGPRQVGKTTLLAGVKEYLEEKGVSPEQIFSFTADRLPQPEYLKNPEALVAHLKALGALKKEKSYLFIDEFQALPQAGLFLKNIFDQYSAQMQIFVSGSSSLEIAKNTEFLTGRKIEKDIMGISFAEWIVYRGGKRLAQEWNPWKKQDQEEMQRFYGLYKTELEGLLLEALNWGAYPEICTTLQESKKQEILAEITSTYLQKDVAAYLKVENITAFNNLSCLLAGQIGQLVNLNEIVNTINLNRATAEKYLSYLEGTYVLSLVRPFHGNLRKEITKMPKVFFRDLGLRNSLLNRSPARSLEEVEGSVVENFIWLDWVKKIGEDKIKYRRTLSGSEVDFIFQWGAQTIPVEVKFRNKMAQLQGLKNIRKEYPDLQKSLVFTKNTLDFSGETLYIPVCLTGCISKKI